jgi:hypothetical protein
VSLGWGLLRVSLAGCVITQTMVAIGASFGLTAVHAVAGNAPAGLVALAWRGLWLTFLASAVPTIMFIVAGVLGLRQACHQRGYPPWAPAAWNSFAARRSGIPGVPRDAQPARQRHPSPQDLQPGDWSQGSMSSIPVPSMSDGLRVASAAL